MISDNEQTVEFEGRAYRVIEDPVYGYRRLDPIPDDHAIARFYQSQYYDLIRRGGRAHELKRLMAGGDAARDEREWLRETLYADIVHVLRAHAAGVRVLDVGCGTGEALAYIREQGFTTAGIEPSSEASAAAVERGLDVLNLTLQEFIEYRNANEGPAMDAVLLLSVLEHVPDPAGTIRAARTLLGPGGLVGIRVPNDFNEIQLTARAKLAKHPWWVAVPDHINYFSFGTLCGLLARLDFDVVYSQGDFPIEMFLLMGDDYVGNDDVGSRCHRRRVEFERSIAPDLRRRMYRALGAEGIARDCLVFGRIRPA